MAAVSLVNALVCSGTAPPAPGTVVVNGGGTIASVLRPGDEPRDVPVHDCGGCLLAPGFIDVQVNGGGGVLFNDDPSVATIRSIGAAHRRYGTTGFVPTLISDHIDTRRAAVAAVRAALATGVPGVLGLHLEGPHLNPARRGVHQGPWLGPPDAEDVAVIGSLGTGVTVATVAPEIVGIEVIRGLAARGVRVCAGHTLADGATVRAALDAGLSGFTHLFNAMPPMAGRDPGPAGVALDDAKSWCGLIVDGHHLDDAMVRLAVRAKPLSKVMLVTDAMPPVGTGLDRFTLYGAPVLVEGGRCMTPDGRLAGSVLDLATAVRLCVRRIGIDLVEALRMASTYPAEFLGLGNRLGRIAPGYLADLVLLDETLTVRETWIAGRGLVHGS